MLTLAESQRKLGHQILDENLAYRSPLESPSPQQVFGAFIRDAVLRPSARTWIDLNR
jgi:hypothetical protein